MAFLKKKAQSGLELAIILSILLLFTVSIFAFMQSRVSLAFKDRNDYLVQNIGNIISSEVRLASSINGDYYREFDLPLTIESKNYFLEKNGLSDITISIEDSSEIVFLNEDIIGDFIQGKNVIKKVDGIISVNS